MFTVLKVSLENPHQEIIEILQAKAALLGFDSFLETENGFESSMPQEEFLQAEWEDLAQEFEGISWQIENVAKQNWNQLWEESYEPIFVNESCRVIAPFHERDSRFVYEILITPKMSFGTGHHPTTALMLDLISQENFFGQNILDLGCGTGVLAILALKKGAESAQACDIDDWAVENTQENAQLNSVNVAVQKATAQAFLGQKFDVVFANINRNVLMEEMHIYSQILKDDGKLFLSGFYEQDSAAISLKASQNGFVAHKKAEKNNWVALQFHKKDFVGNV